MSANVQIAGLPPVLRVKIHQGSMETPGRVVADTVVVGPNEITKTPTKVTMVIYARNWTGFWHDLKVVKAPRVRRGYTRWVLEDNRWKLRETFLHENYNERDSLGKVMSGSQRTISQLAFQLSAATGLSIIATNDVPSFAPRAKWAGVRADIALKNLLHDTGCRMVYNPIEGTYRISLCGVGGAPDVTTRHFRPGPPPKIKKLIVRTAPVLYEDTIDVSAVRINTSTGATEALPTPVNLASSATEDYGQTRLRLWAPSSVSHPSSLNASDVLLLDHRAKTHMYDPDRQMHERARIVRDDWDRFPYHQPMYVPDKNDTSRMIELTGGGRAFLTDHPVLMTDSSGSLLTSAKLVTSYYVKEDNELKRNTKEIVIPGDGTDTLTVTVPWLKPVDSTLPDMSGSQWGTLLDQVAQAIAYRFNYLGRRPEVVSLESPQNLNGSGQVGAVEYEFQASHNRPRIYFRVALNYDPGSPGLIR